MQNRFDWMNAYLMINVIVFDNWHWDLETVLINKKTLILVWLRKDFPNIPMAYGSAVHSYTSRLLCRM